MRRVPLRAVTGTRPTALDVSYNNSPPDSSPTDMAPLVGGREDCTLGSAVPRVGTHVVYLRRT